VRALAAALAPDRGRLALPAPAGRRSRLRLDDLLRDLDGFDDAAGIGPYVSVARSGLHTLSGPDDEALDVLDRGRLERLLAFVARFYELVFLDVEGLPAPVLRAAVRRADRVVLVGGAEPADRPAGSAVLDAIESERREPATLVINRADARVAAERVRGPVAGWAIVPEDRELIRALDAGDYRLADRAALTRAALKRLALLVAEGVA
jgi:hypothetical protein